MSEQSDIPPGGEVEQAALTHALTTGIKNALFSDAAIEFDVSNEDVEGVYDFERFIPLRSLSLDGRYLLALKYSYDAIDTSKIDLKEHPDYASGSGLEPFLDIHLFDTRDSNYYGITGIAPEVGYDDFIGLDEYPKGTEVQIITESQDIKGSCTG